MSKPVSNRYDFTFLFDVRDGNPNGDPDNNNMPRQDPETLHGLVSDVSIKRKIRDYVARTRPDQPGYDIFVTNEAVLELKQQRAWEAIAPAAKPSERSTLPKDPDTATAITRWMCDTYFDVRAFGAVMSTSGANCGQVRGPLQLTFARSIEPVAPIEIAVTRMAVTTQAEADSKKANRTFGRRHILPYALFRAHGFISAPLAERTGFSEDDFAVLLEAFASMLDHDRASARGHMSPRRLVLFQHADSIGNAPAHQLLERVNVLRTFAGDEFSPADPRTSNFPPARSYEDYAVHVDTHNLPSGITVQDISL